MSLRGDTVPIFHGISSAGAKGGNVFFGVARFIRNIEQTYARPGGRIPKGSPIWPYHTFNDDFHFAAEKLWDVIWKIERIATLIHYAREKIKDLDSGTIIETDLASHQAALRDIPIYFDALIVYLRIVADCIANLTPYLYGQKGKFLTRSSFREQRQWFIGKRRNFDLRYAEILESNTKWFDVLAGCPPDYIGLRDAIIHYRGGIQVIYRPGRGEGPPAIMPMLFSDRQTLTLNLFTLLQRVMLGLCVFFDHFLEHFNALIAKQTRSIFMNLDSPDSVLLFHYEADLPSDWLFPSVGGASMPTKDDV